ncbi:MAG: hypothetical protein CMA63_06595 [Euryarchaeota archaeon]|nr:hypothetical protein [Euryarchaeota archaeon]|tara:strand:+ start:4007 stop:4576 length:570 start_codon:yes stop_codon:yes gene_type:complete
MISGAEVAAVYVDIDSLTPWADNPRQNEHAVDPIMRSIEEFGFTSPIVARTEDREIIAGHTRWTAAKRLGMKRVPVRFVDLTQQQARALAIADNRLGELADWDATLLESTLRELGDFDQSLLDVTGFAEELDSLFSQEDDGFGDDGSGAGNDPTKLEYRVVIENLDEKQQASLVEKLEKEGFKCHALIS